MFTVSVLAQNGGVGKTTIAVTLTVLAELDGLSAGLVDADPSANAFLWHERRVRVQKKETPPFAVAPSPESLTAALDAGRADGLDWCFIDTGAGVSPLARFAAEQSDLLLIPCIGSANKIDGNAPTAKLVKQLKAPAFFVINLGSSSKSINDDAALTLTSKFGVPAVATHITDRKPIRYIEDFGLALPEIEDPNTSQLAGTNEFRALWQWVKAQNEVEGAGYGDAKKNLKVRKRSR